MDAELRPLKCWETIREGQPFMFSAERVDSLTGCHLMPKEFAYQPVVYWDKPINADGNIYWNLEIVLVDDGQVFPVDGFSAGSSIAHLTKNGFRTPIDARIQGKDLFYFRLSRNSNHDEDTYQQDVKLINLMLEPECI